MRINGWPGAFSAVAVGLVAAAKALRMLLSQLLDNDWSSSRVAHLLRLACCAGIAAVLFAGLASRDGEGRAMSAARWGAFTAAVWSLYQAGVNVDLWAARILRELQAGKTLPEIAPVWWVSAYVLAGLCCLGIMWATKGRVEPDAGIPGGWAALVAACAAACVMCVETLAQSYRLRGGTWPRELSLAAMARLPRGMTWPLGTSLAVLAALVVLTLVARRMGWACAQRPVAWPALCAASVVCLFLGAERQWPNLAAGRLQSTMTVALFLGLGTVFGAAGLLLRWRAGRHAEAAAQS